MTIDDLPYLNVFSPEYAADPNSVIDPVRAVSPLARSERGVEILAYSDCEDLLRDTGLATGFIEMFEASGISEGPAVDAFKFGIVESEGADHTRLRKAVARYFTARKIESLRATAHDLVKLWLVESAEQGTIDFEAAIGRRLPASLFCMLIGAPLEDSGAMAEYSDGVTRIFQYDPKHRDFIDSRCAELGDYIRRLMGQRRAAPGDDLLSVLVAAQDSGQLTETEVVSMCMVLLGGSTDTTNAQMCMNTLALARHLSRTTPASTRSVTITSPAGAPASARSGDVGSVPSRNTSLIVSGSPGSGSAPVCVSITTFVTPGGRGNSLAGRFSSAAFMKLTHAGSAAVAPASFAPSGFPSS